MLFVSIGLPNRDREELVDGNIVPSGSCTFVDKAA